MKHPFEVLKPEYTEQLSRLVILPARARLVDDVARKMIRLYHSDAYGEVPEKTGIPILLMGPSFEREASSNFNLSPAQGDPWRRASINVPAHRGPFTSWEAAALDAYHLNGLDQVGRDNWTWELMCFYEEIFNGLGYRDAHRIPSPYVFGATNIQRPGKYVADHVYNPTEMDQQLGCIAMARRMVEIDPSLNLPGNPWPFPETDAPPQLPLAAPVMPAPSGLGGEDQAHDARWIQHAVNLLGQSPKIDEDGSYGSDTRHAVMAYQARAGLRVDGFAGPDTVSSLVASLAARGLT